MPDFSVVRGISVRGPNGNSVDQFVEAYYLDGEFYETLIKQMYISMCKLPVRYVREVQRGREVEDLVGPVPGGQD